MLLDDFLLVVNVQQLNDGATLLNRCARELGNNKLVSALGLQFAHHGILLHHDASPPLCSLVSRLLFFLFLAADAFHKRGVTCNRRPVRIFEQVSQSH